MGTQNRDEKRALETAETARETKWEFPSFVSEMFMGRVKTELIFPFPEQNAVDRQAGEEILAKLQTFLRDKVDADRIDMERDIPKEVLDGLKKLGLFGIKIPAEYGGLGFSQVNYNRIVQMVASHCASTAVLLSAHQSIGVPQPLKMFGTEAQKKKYLPRLAKGEISAFALTEPDVGSDPSKMTTIATSDDGGDTFLISGKKLWISNGPMADLMIVMARTNSPTEDRPEITAFIVEGNAAGLTVEHRCDFMGLKGIKNGLLNFDKVKVSKDDIVEGIGRGLSLALRTLNTGRLTLPAACGGAMKQVLAITREWANQRVQWGAPVGQHEAVASKIASMAADLYAVESLTWLTSALADQAKTDIRLEAAMAKLYCSEALWRTVDAGVQVRGGRGYETADSLRGRGEMPMPMERLMRDARINMIIEGTSEIMRLFIAREALDPHLRIAGASATSGKVDYQAAAKYYARWYPPLWLPGFTNKDIPTLVARPLKKHLRYVHRATRALARDLFHMIVLHQQGLQKRQMVLGRLIDCGAELFAMIASISKASASLDAGEWQVADLFCRQAKRRICILRRSVYFNDDRKTSDLAQQALSGKIAWLENNIVSTWKTWSPNNEEGDGQ
ncbi:MAG: acyl-CoA dehydrogenase family protein [Deltaproteobacteria bacterium]|jgi:alkylation response protein AidB-like acyl-CoA dehydrogenase|nr:acyl-CoA dehydrogenase family protein [Deltaproteobacteria bacterium]